MSQARAQSRIFGVSSMLKKWKMAMAMEEADGTVDGSDELDRAAAT
jgi:hypothetical protein